MNALSPAVPDRVYLQFDRDEAIVLLEVLAPHRGRGTLRYAHEQVRRALEPPAYRWAVPDVAHAAQDAVAEVEGYFGQASTMESARDALHRLSCALARAGAPVPVDGSSWRGSVLSLLTQNGFRLHTGEREFRLILPNDHDQWRPSGPTLGECVAAWRERAERAEVRA